MVKTLLITTSAYNYLQAPLLEAYPERFEAGSICRQKFPDEESYLRIETEIAGRHVCLIGGTINDESTLELFDLANGCFQLSALSLTIILPYFGYSTMERSTKPGEIVKAKTRALLLSSIPKTPMGNKIVMVDLHAEGIPYYFDGDVQTQHIYSKPLIAQTVKKIAGEDFVLASTDAGRAKWVESLGNDLNVKCAFIYKKRLSGETTEILAINAPVRDKIVVIYDDIIRTGGTLMQAAAAYHQAGALQIFAVCTHGILANDVMNKIEKQGLIQKVFVLNTHPNSIKINHPLLEVVDFLPLLENCFYD